MKKLLVLAAVVAGVLFAIKRSKDAQAEADLWREATAPSSGTLGGASVNGTTPKTVSTPGTAANN